MSELRKQLIRDRVEGLAAVINVPNDMAFEKLVHSLLTGESPHTSSADDWVDGAQDKQVDIISLEMGADEIDVHIIQAKYSDSFPSNQLILMANGLDWIFNKTREQLNSLTNIDFKDKIIELRSSLNAVGYSNARIHCYYACLSDESAISDEFKQEQKSILAKFDNGTFESFSFTPLGSGGLVDLIGVLEKKNKTINAKLKIRYDSNNPSLIKYQSQGLTGIVCTSDATQIADLVKNDKQGALFDANIRRFLGHGKAVNREILGTATDPSTSYLFWFLNNGITIICDHVHLNTDPDDAHLQITNLQIVNGCQTASALAHAAKENTLKPDTRVLLKIFETKDKTLSSKVVLTTNNQNKINTRDLKANDAIQQDMQNAFAQYKLLYEHKANQYAGYVPTSGERFVSNEMVGQSYLALILRDPSDARRRKYKIWSDFYTRIFNGEDVKAHVFATLVCLQVVNWSVTAKKEWVADELRRKVVANGAFHIARAAASTYMKSDLYNKNDAALKTSIVILQANPSLMNVFFDQGLERIVKEIEKNPVFAADVDGALKSSLLDGAITKTFFASSKNKKEATKTPPATKTNPTSLKKPSPKAKK